MQLLISCAKTMSEAPDIATPRVSVPRFDDTARSLAAHLATLPADELARLLRVNRTLAAENHRRYTLFHDAGVPAAAALAAYSGIVFRYLDPGSFSAADFEYAQQHLHITSFLYGLLRPLDAIRPYRLEGDVVIPGGEQAPFDFWPARLTPVLLDAVRRDDNVLVNLASGEMKRLFDWRRLAREVRIITPEFRVREGERLRTVVVYTKMCRGAMARSILRNRPEDPEQLKAFEWEGFRYDPAASRGDRWVFTLG
ncbi:YaaA family protein [uncultured Alistipes sp.]|uniref:YaaA family protein n=1 Tax=uncultured Alistipes sp. TaxID=538949 RepID=UPI00262F0AD9|nr:YaaA family protein [uncultured Alistipes sp.]